MTAEVNNNKAEAKSTSPVSRSKMSASGKLAITLSLLLAAGGVAGAGYLFLQLQQAQQKVEQLVQNTVEQQQAQQIFQAALEQKLEAQATQRNEMHQQVIEEVKRQVAASQAAMQTQIAGVSGRQPAYWLIAEARYLVDLAEKRLNIEHDVTTAIELLMSAEKRLAELSSREAFAMRQIIAKDITKAQAHTIQDKSQYYQVINGVINRMDSLVIKALDIPKYKVGEGKQTYSAWDTFLTNLKQFSQHIFRVNYYRGDIAPFISPEHQALIRGNIRQQLLVAQAALLRDEPKAYYAAIEQTQEWLSKYFEQSGGDYSFVSERLKTLKLANITKVQSIALESAAALKTWLIAQPLPKISDKQESSSKETQHQVPEAK